MTKATNTAAIERATGKSWEEWMTFFESIDAANLSHKEIAQKVYDAGTPGWWSQMVTVAFEQEIGRRVPGQDNDGEFNVSVTKTIDGTMDDALNLWLKLVNDQSEFGDIDITREPKVTKTEKWRYWRAGLADGSAIVVTIYEKAAGKSGLAVTHEKLESSHQVEHWRAYWKTFLQDL